MLNQAPNAGMGISCRSIRHRQISLDSCLGSEIPTFGRSQSNHHAQGGIPDLQYRQIPYVEGKSSAQSSQGLDSGIGAARQRNE